MTTGLLRRWRALLAVLVLLGAACGSSGNDTTVTETTTTSVAETTTAAETTTSEAPDVEADEPDDEDESTDEDEPVAPVGFVGDATLIDGAFMPVDAGTYRVDTLGTPISFTSTRSLFVQPNDTAFFVLTEPSSQGPDDRDLVFLRPSELADPTKPNATLDEQGDGWPNDDIEGWLDTLHPDVVVSNRQNVQVDGLDTVRFELRLADDATCSTDELFCYGFATNRVLNGKSLEVGSTYRVWWIDQGDEDPIAAIAGIQRDLDESWFDVAEDVMSTLAFGEIMPNPVPDGDLLELGFGAEAAAGPVTLPTMGGVTFELPADEFVNQFGDADYFIVTFGDMAASTELFVAGRTNPLVGSPEEDFAASEPIGTVEEAVAWLTEQGATMTELDESTIDGVPALVFDITTNPSGPPPAFIPAGVEAGEAVGWFAPPDGRLWLADTDLGVLVLTAEAFESADDLAATIERSEAIRSTLDLAAIG